MTARTNIQTKQRKQLHIDNLRGVDFFNSPVNVQKNRAVDMLNFTIENGTHKKRNGWRSITAKMQGRINGIFPYKNENQTEILVYAGNVFYRLVKNSKEGAPDFVVKENFTYEGLVNRRCQVFQKDDSLYIVGCGKYLRYYKSEDGVYKIGEIEPYIPTTTIDIDPEGTEADVRATLEPVNILTNTRKNKLTGGIANSKWQLDGTVEIFKNRKTVTVEISIQRIDEETNIVTNQSVTLGNHMGGPGLYDDSGTQGGTIEANGILTLYDDTTSIERNNITVTFLPLNAPAKETSDIDQCTIGTLFGVGGAADRLFLSGNAAHKNIVWFSEMDNFTYFHDQYTAAFGTNQQAITAMLRLNDNTLAVFKEPMYGEPTIYYQTGTYRTTYDDSGEIERITPVFSITAGESNESALNNFSCDNLDGDDLILSQHGVFEIRLLENVQSDAHIARPKSVAINSMLTKNSLKDASAIVHKGKIYISTGSKCFVGNKNYQYMMQGVDAYQYEWFYWDNITARVWAEIDETLCFGSQDGYICMFGEGYADELRQIGEDGDFTIDHANDEIVFNERHSVNIGDRVQIQTAGVYAVALRAENIKYIDGRNYVKKGSISFEDLFAMNGIRLYDKYPGTSDMLDHPFFIEDIQKEDGEEYVASFLTKVSDGTTGYIAFQIGIVYDTSFKDLYVSEINERDIETATMKSFKVRLSRASEQDLDFEDIVLQKNASNLQVVIYRDMPVKARWITPVFDMGGNGVSKTLYNLCISMNPESRGKIRFGYSTRNDTGEQSLTSASQWNIAKTNFNFFSFEPVSWLSYTAKVKVPRFNFIQFWFEHDDAEECSINDFTATYSIISRNLGVR